MAFKMNLLSKDEKLFHDFNGKQENICTYGRGSYSGNFSPTTGYGRLNILGGRFCSLSVGIVFLIGGNHS